MKERPMAQQKPTRPGPVQEPPGGPDKPGQHAPVKEPESAPSPPPATGLTSEHIRCLMLIADRPGSDVPPHIAYDLRQRGLAQGSFICMRITEPGWRFLRLSTIRTPHPHAVRRAAAA